jgi:hypothetical protein
MMQFQFYFDGNYKRDRCTFQPNLVELDLFQKYICLIFGSPSNLNTLLAIFFIKE